jgi:hypothetical protein
LELKSLKGRCAMLYEKTREMASLSMERWLSDEILSLGWFIEIGILIVAYIIWLKLFDKRRATELLLIGSLAAVAYTLNSMMSGNILGLAEYLVRIFPSPTNVFISSITLSPIILMLSEQYSSTWGGYMIRSAIGLAFMCFGIFTLYVAVGAVQFHNWNVFYHFLVLFAISLLVRCAFLWITGIQKRHLSMQDKKA